MNKKILLGIIAIIIVIGAIITGIKGLNFDITYTANKQVEIYIGKDFEVKDIEKIAKEVIGGQILVQKVELYEEIASIKASDITDEQIDEIVNKIEEKYETQINRDDDVITTSNPKLRGRDLVRPYILPIAISVVLVLAYAGIRFIKVNSLEVISKIIGLNILSQLFYLSVLAITRIPVNRLTIPIAIAIYIATTLTIIISFENKEKMIEKTNKNSKQK